MAVGGKDIVIRAAIEGAGEIGKTLKDLQAQLDKLAIDGAKTGDPFKSIPTTTRQSTEAVKGFNQELGLSRQQALALTYTFNDVTASIASGISPMTILLQQGGQLTQAFGGIGGFVKTIGPQLIKWGPWIAAAATAAAGVVATFDVLNRSADAAKKLSDLANANERARVSQEAINKLSAALIAKGVSSDEAPKRAEQIFGKLRNTLLSTRDAQVELNKSRKEFAKTVQPPGVGESAFDQLENTGKFLKTVKPPTDSGRIGPVVNKFSELKDIVSRYGYDVTKVKGTEEDLYKLIIMLTEAYRRAGSEAKKFKLALEIDKIDPKLTEIVKAGGMGFVNQEDAKAAALGPRPTSAQVRAGQEANIAAEQLKRAEEDKTLALDAQLVSSSKAKTEARIADLKRERDEVSLLNQAYQQLNQVITSVFEIKKGNPLVSSIPAIVGGLAYNAADSLGVLSPTPTTVDNSKDRGILQGAVAAIGELAYQAALAAGALQDTATAARVRDGSPNSPFPGMATGGFVSGPGTSTSDSIPAWLSSGEYVVRAAAVKRYGVGLMHAINGMAAPRRGFGFASGGLVPPSSVAMAGGSSGGRGLTLVLDGKSFGGMSGSNDAMDALERYAIARRISSTTKRTPSRVG